MKKNIKLLVLILFILGFIRTILFLKDNEISQKDFYDNAVENVASKSYEGIVIDKYYDKYNHGVNKIILSNNQSIQTIDFIYQHPEVYEYIEIGDTLIKRKNSLELEIKRINMDTIIYLKFENLKKR